MGGFVRALKGLVSCFFPLANKPFSSRSDESLCQAVESDPLANKSVESLCRDDESVALANKPVDIRSDESLLLAVESAINAANEPVKEEFPYKVHVEPYTTGIKLTREYHGEIINVKSRVSTVSMSTWMDVEISRKSGNCLRFECWKYFSDNSIEIISLEVELKESSSKVKREVARLDKNLQKALVKYLDVRGINLSTIKFIEDHWKKEDSKMNKLCLEKLEEFFVKE